MTNIALHFRRPRPDLKPQNKKTAAIILRRSLWLGRRSTLDVRMIDVNGREIPIQAKMLLDDLRRIEKPCSGIRLIVIPAVEKESSPGDRAPSPGKLREIPRADPAPDGSADRIAADTLFPGRAVDASEIHRNKRIVPVMRGKTFRFLARQVPKRVVDRKQCVAHPVSRSFFRIIRRSREPVDEYPPRLPAAWIDYPVSFRFHGEHRAAILDRKQMDALRQRKMVLDIIRGREFREYRMRERLRENDVRRRRFEDDDEHSFEIVLVGKSHVEHRTRRIEHFGDMAAIIDDRRAEQPSLPVARMEHRVMNEVMRPGFEDRVIHVGGKRVCFRMAPIVRRDPIAIEISARRIIESFIFSDADLLPEYRRESFGYLLVRVFRASARGARKQKDEDTTRKNKYGAIAFTHGVRLPVRSQARIRPETLSTAIERDFR